MFLRGLQCQLAVQAFPDAEVELAGVGTDERDSGIGSPVAFSSSTTSRTTSRMPCRASSWVVASQDRDGNSRQVPMN